MIWHPAVADAVGVAPAILDIVAASGEIVERTVTILNTDSVARTFTFQTEEFTPSPNEPGVAIFDGGAKSDAPSWPVFSPPRVSLAAGASQSVNVSVAVPVGAVPSDYFIAAFVRPESSGSAEAQAALLVFLTVTGNARYGIEIASLELTRAWSSNASATLDLAVQNSGNVYVKPSGYAFIDPLIGRSVLAEANQIGSRILPGQTRRWQVGVGTRPSGNFFRDFLGELRALAIGPAKISVALSAGDVSDTRTARLWIFPWRVGIVALSFGVLFSLFRVLLRSRSSSLCRNLPSSHE